MRYWLAGVLVVVAAAVCRAEASDVRPALIGMSGDEVRKVMGEPTWVDSWESAWVDHLSAYWYIRTDCFGGVWGVRVLFDAKERVNKVHTYYRPLPTARPGWTRSKTPSRRPQNSRHFLSVWLALLPPRLIGKRRFRGKALSGKAAWSGGSDPTPRAAGREVRAAAAHVAGEDHEDPAHAAARPAAARAAAARTAPSGP